MSAIDSLMWHQPDSALACLIPYFDTCCRDAKFCVSTTTAYNRHYAHLLLSELLYKNDYTQSNRKDLLQAVHYFDSLCGCTNVARNVSTIPTIAFLDARAHYINGVGYYEKDSVVEACMEYMKALEVMEEYFEEKEPCGIKAKFMALTYTRLTDLFSDLYLHEQAIYFAQLSLSYYQKYNASPNHIAWILNSIGSQFEIMEELDSAFLYYQNAITSISDTSVLMYRDILTLKTGLLYKMYGLSDTSIPQLQNLISLAQDNKEKSARYLALGEILYYEKQFDSAFVYLKKVFDGSTRTDSKKQVAEWLVEICKAQGKEAEMIEYANYLVPFANKEENNSVIKSELTELYNAFRQRVSDCQHQRIIKKNAQWTAVTIGVLLIIMLAIICFYYKNKQRLKLLESQNPQKSTKVQDKLLAFMEEPICQEIIHSVQGKNIKRMATPKAFPELILTDEQLKQLNLIVTHYFGSMDSLLERHGLKAKNALVNLCHLYLLGMDEKQAAILLNRDYSSVKRYEKTLKTAFHTQENMVILIRNMVLNP
ncbi:MAG: hypothetical protein IKX35_10245 [Bacteroidales bacterium]|nr:hypothetical protein [Bacteroidales bacterium]